MQLLLMAMAEQRAKTEQFCFFLGSWYNATRIDAKAQSPNLRDQELNLRVLSRPEPSQNQGHKREKEMIHTNSFRSAKLARGRGNTWHYGKRTHPLGRR